MRLYESIICSCADPHVRDTHWQASKSRVRLSLSCLGCVAVVSDCCNGDHTGRLHSRRADSDSKSRVWVTTHDSSHESLARWQARPGPGHGLGAKMEVVPTTWGPGTTSEIVPCRRYWVVPGLFLSILNYSNYSQVFLGLFLENFSLIITHYSFILIFITILIIPI